MLVSIIVPIYNSAQYIEETIHSVYNQTYTNWELLVVNDGSTDNSIEVVSKFISDKVKLIDNHNKGASAARNIGFTNSKGDYIQFLDADDILSTNKIEKQIKLLLKSQDNAISSCSWSRFSKSVSDAYKKPEKVWKNYSIPINWLIDSWEGGGMMLNSCWLVPRKIVEKSGLWNEKLSLNDDGEFFSRIIINCTQIVYEDDCSVFYRSELENSLSKQRTEKAIKSAFRVCELYEEHMLKFKKDEKVKHALMMNYLNFIYENYPVHHELLKKAKERIKNLGFNKLSITGGKKFRFLANLIGFENALRLRKFFSF